MTEYLWQKSQEREELDPYKPLMTYGGGDAQRGKELITSVGCISCHQVEGIKASLKVKSQKAPFLTGTGSKVNPHWLVSWLKKPSHYQPSTIMPSFRLSNQEAQDMAAYLLSLKNENFTKKEIYRARPQDSRRNSSGILYDLRHSHRGEKETH